MGLASIWPKTASLLHIFYTNLVLKVIVPNALCCVPDMKSFHLIFIRSNYLWLSEVLVKMFLKEFRILQNQIIFYGPVMKNIKSSTKVITLITDHNSKEMESITWLKVLFYNFDQFLNY